MQPEPKHQPHEEVNPVVDFPCAHGIDSYLTVQAEQVEAASCFAEQPIDGVIECLIEITLSMKVLESAIAADDERARVVHGTVLELCNKSIRNLQFSDELTQRLEHISKSLVDLRTQVTTPGPHDGRVNWPRIEEQMRERYSTEAERDIHARSYGNGRNEEPTHRE